MSGEKQKPGEALATADRKRKRRWADLSNQRKNEIARKQWVYGGDLTREELVEKHKRLKAEYYERSAV